MDSARAASGRGLFVLYNKADRRAGKSRLFFVRAPGRVLTCGEYSKRVRLPIRRRRKTFKPNSEFLVADCDLPAHRLMRFSSRLIGRLDVLDTIDDNFNGLLPAPMTNTSGFKKIQEPNRRQYIFRHNSLAQST